MIRHLLLKNRQKKRSLPLPELRQKYRRCLDELLAIPDYELAIHFVTDDEMAETNWQYLQHEGSTDVITFNHRDLGVTSEVPAIFGEIFICPEEAVRQARQFQTTWQDEILRYGVHGILHLLGYDDLKAKDRKVMKKEENRLMKRLAIAR